MKKKYKRWGAGEYNPSPEKVAREGNKSVAGLMNNKCIVSKRRCKK